LSGRPRVRPARPDDAPEIAGWFAGAAAARVWGGPEVPFPVPVEWLTREFCGRSRAYFVLPDGDDRPLGLIGIRRHVRGRRVHLIRVAIRPDRRGEGLVGALFEAVASVARLGGAERLSLNVYGSNEGAIRAYERFGFTAVGARPAPEDASGVAIRMTRAL
jgi:RimJ/RimL family protein N-acetyltransferase